MRTIHFAFRMPPSWATRPGASPTLPLGLVQALDDLCEAGEIHVQGWQAQVSMQVTPEQEIRLRAFMARWGLKESEAR